MFAFIHGVVADKGHNELVIEAGGVGYSLYCSLPSESVQSVFLLSSSG